MSSYRHVLEYYKVQELRLHIKTEILSDIFDYQIVYILMTTLNKILEKKKKLFPQCMLFWKMCNLQKYIPWKTDFN